MSWGVSVTGTKAKVVEVVKAAKGYGDESQLDAAKAFIASEVEKFPDDLTPQGITKGVRVIANGHHDSGSRNVSITIEQSYLAL